MAGLARVPRARGSRPDPLAGSKCCSTPIPEETTTLKETT